MRERRLQLPEGAPRGSLAKVSKDFPSAVDNLPDGGANSGRVVEPPTVEFTPLD